MNKNKSVLLSIIFVVCLAIIVAGSTYAYWVWNSSNSTAVSFTVTANFSCSADGGGDINANNLVPTECSGSNVIKRTITTNANGSGNIYMDLWLDVVSIDSSLSQSDNLKYVLTTSNTSCTTGIVGSGTFNGSGANSKLPLFNSNLFNGTSSKTYYLYIWLDKNETNINTTDKSFSLKLNGSCTDKLSE